MSRTSPRLRRGLRSSLPLQPTASTPRLRWADQLRRSEASTAVAEPIAVSHPLRSVAAASTAWLTPASSSALSAQAIASEVAVRPWWIYLMASAIASAFVSSVLFSLTL